VLPPPSGSSSTSDPIPSSPTYNDEIPNLHPIQLHGLDVSASDLAFAVQTTTPPQDAGNEEGNGYRLHAGVRWEDLEVTVWKGGLEVINEEFVDVECIVSTEVLVNPLLITEEMLIISHRVEHLSQDILPAFAPILLGVYHPRLLLITTPSYTFNARFTAPMASPSARKGYPDPTGRTDRIFRHDDYKFEWTVEEFQAWCHEIAHEWGYEVHVSSVGRATDIDIWGRDDELGGATSVAVFKQLENETRETRSREFLKTLPSGGLHELLAKHQHVAHPSSQKPKPIKDIGDSVKAKMEEFREAFMMVEELWFERDIAIACGGWIEVLIRAIEECDSLVLKRDGEGIKNERGRWIVELVGGVANQKAAWTNEGNGSLDHIPTDWIPGEGETESSEGEWGLGSTDMEGDVSCNGSEDEDDIEKPKSSGWGSGGWGMLNESEKDETADRQWNDIRSRRILHSSGSSTTGWDGDESDDTS
jgi:small RNA 2'-O-methyltransferase